MELYFEIARLKREWRFYHNGEPPEHVQGNKPVLRRLLAVERKVCGVGNGNEGAFFTFVSNVWVRDPKSQLIQILTFIIILDFLSIANNINVNAEMLFLRINRILKIIGIWLDWFVLHRHLPHTHTLSLQSSLFFSRQSNQHSLHSTGFEINKKKERLYANINGKPQE